MPKPRVPKLRLAVVAATVLGVFWAVTISVVRGLGLSGPLYYGLLGLLGVLGLVLAGSVYWFASKVMKGRAAPPVTPEADELSGLIANARRRLESAESTKSPFSELPLLLILGPPGSAKSSLVVESELQAELLAGNAPGGGTPDPTRTANIWYTDRTIYLEAAHSVTSDDDLWRLLLEAIRPRRLRASFTSQGQAARAVVICLPARAFLNGSERDALQRLAQELRTRLFEMADELGTQLPVYVVLTKMDEVPHFEDFVRNFTDEEAQRVLGTTLPYLDLSEAANYVAGQTARAASALEAIFRSLALKRLRFLGRETVAQRAASAYEFPREFKKLQNPIVRFVVELVRPSQLDVSPFLRGIYFVGRRTVEVRAAPQAVERAPDPGSSFGATRIFSAADLSAPPPAPSTAPGRGLQWVFLPRILRDVVLRDRSVLELTTGGSKVTKLRRLVFTGALALIGIVGLQSTWSFFSNRSLAARVQADIATLGQLPQGQPTVGALAALDSVRLRVEELADREERRPLLRQILHVGLYRGSQLYATLRPAYFRAFEGSLYGVARDSLVSVLAGLPRAPDETTDYLSTYNRLRSYLILTDTAQASTEEFLAPQLLQHTPGLGSEEARTLAEAQYLFFARELQRENPFPRTTVDEALVTSTRQFLGQAGGFAPFYARMVGLAGAGNRDLPAQSLNGLMLADPVRAAFTSSGRQFVEQWLGQPADSIVQTEEWVVGTEIDVPEPAEVVDSLGARYSREYVAAWRRHVLSAAVVPFGSSARQAADRIDELVTSPGSLGEYTMIVGINQTADALNTEFQPIGAFWQTDTLGINQAAGPSPEADAYLSALDALGNQLGVLADALNSNDPAGVSEQAQGVRDRAATARTAARDLSSNFGRVPEYAALRQVVTNLINYPIDRAETIAGGAVRIAEVSPLREQGDQFCTAFAGEVGDKFPFASAADAPSASLDEIGRVFRRDDGRVWNLGRFLEDNGYAQRAADLYEPSPGSPINSRFLDFLGSARRFSRGLYPEGSSSPLVQFSVQPVRHPNATLYFQFEGRRVECSASSCNPDRFDWRGGPGDLAQLEVVVGSRSVSYPFSGTWGLFRLFRMFSGWGSEQTHQLSWPVVDEGGVPVEVGGQQVVIRMDVTMLNSAPPVFDARLLNDLRRCVPILAN